MHFLACCGAEATPSSLNSTSETNWACCMGTPIHIAWQLGKICNICARGAEFALPLRSDQFVAPPPPQKCVHVSAFGPNAL